MNTAIQTKIAATSYLRGDCDIGVVHLGFGAFHRAHQAVYLDDYMGETGDLRWGIAAVNLRGAEADHFQKVAKDTTAHDGYFLKSYSHDGEVALRRVRSHVGFADWSRDKAGTEALLSLPTVQLVTVTVTESGYYTTPEGELNVEDPVIAREFGGQAGRSIYAFLRGALSLRMTEVGKPLTIACCDNIRSNGKMLRRNVLTYLRARSDHALADWVEANIAFPCSMVDRITPRPPEELATEMAALVGQEVTSPVMAEDFIQWVLEDKAAGPMPDLARVGVTVTSDVDPYEETKIRVLNGGHTALTYLAALSGIETFDGAMRDPALYDHFRNFETQEVLPAIDIDLPFSKAAYLDAIDKRFGNRAIGDTVARICADGMVKFPIFIRPTLEGCLKQGILPRYSIRSVASWHVFACHAAAGKVPFTYVEPNWDDLVALLGTDAFVTSTRLWGDLPTTYPAFAEALRAEISELEQKWPV